VERPLREQFLREGLVGEQFLREQFFRRQFFRRHRDSQWGRWESLRTRRQRGQRPVGDSRLG
jgi:hypothetical protein